MVVCPGGSAGPFRVSPLCLGPFRVSPLCAGSFCVSPFCAGSFCVSSFKVDQPPGRADDVRPEGQVRHEVPVHDIRLDPVDTGPLEVSDPGAEAREVRRQYRGDQRRTWWNRHDTSR